jgi:hypothetical protein
MENFITPVNTNICQGSGTIFSNNNGGGSSAGGTTYEFVNLGQDGAVILAGAIGNIVQFKRVKQGKNIVLTPEANDVLFDVNDLAFDSTAPIKRAIPGLQGISLNGQGVIDTLNKLLYPTLPPTIGVGLNFSVFEYGDNSSLVAGWQVTRTDEPIVTISVNGQSQGVTGNSQSGTIPITKTGLTNVTVPMNVTTATQTVSSGATASVSRKIRVGGSTKDGFVSVLTDADLNGLQGIYSSTAKLPQTQLVINSANYLVICIPVALGTTPTFKINGFVNNAFSLARTNQSFVNNFGFNDNVNVWVSNSFATGPILLEIV